MTHMIMLCCFFLVFLGRRMVPIYFFSLYFFSWSKTDLSEKIPVPKMQIFLNFKTPSGGGHIYFRLTVGSVRYVWFRLLIELFSYGTASKIWLRTNNIKNMSCTATFSNWITENPIKRKSDEKNKKNNRRVKVELVYRLEE